MLKFHLFYPNALKFQGPEIVEIGQNMKKFRTKFLVYRESTFILNCACL